jgi:hypothetical protein|tara:strand:- start:1383 stop:1607 length:225 start_codon:yes stop_codon:yes gene_type:complete
MSEGKAKAKQTNVLKGACAGDVVICIGKASKTKPPRGVTVWHIEGEETTEHGDRYSIAKLTPADLYDLGWIRRK